MIDSETDENSHPQKAEEPSPHSDCDWAYWAKMSGWRASEAAALLLSLDPDAYGTVVDPLSLEKNTPRWEHFRLERLITRACIVNELVDPIIPLSFVVWCKENEIQVPQELKKALNFGYQIVDWRKIALSRSRIIRNLRKDLKLAQKPPVENIQHKSRLSSSIILYAIAAKHYRYNPEGNSPAATNIYKTLELYKFRTPKPETILIHLAEAYAFMKENDPREPEEISEIGQSKPISTLS